MVYNSLIVYDVENNDKDKMMEVYIIGKRYWK